MPPSPDAPRPLYGVPTLVPGVLTSSNLHLIVRSRPTGQLVHLITQYNTGFTSFGLDSIKDLPPVHINQNFPIIKKSFSCDIPGDGSPSVKGSLEASIDASIHAVVQVGVAAEGTIIPPRIDSFGLFAALEADISGTLNIVASAAVSPIFLCAQGSANFPFREPSTPGLSISSSKESLDWSSLGMLFKLRE